MDHERTVHEVCRDLQLFPTPLLIAFFSSRNVEKLHRMLRLRVLEKTGHAIDRQSDEDLTTIMRCVYRQQNREGNDKVKIEVKRLNKIVLASAVPNVLVNLRSYLLFLRDQSGHREFLDRPINASQVGTKLQAYDPSF